jgi:fructokinase
MAGTLPQQAIDMACAIGALVAEAPGANPVITQEQVTAIMEKK